MAEEEKKKDFTPEQKVIIGAPIENTLVSAAAGSGKTTVLVERIIQKLLKGEVAIDRLLVLTFTEAAAQNMLVKINSAIKKKISEVTDPDIRKMLKTQLSLLPYSHIQTIDSFCNSVIREKGSEAASFEHETGLTIVSESEKDVILLQAANKAITETYLSFGDPRELENSDYLRLTSFFGDGRSDDQLANSLVATYKKLRSLPNYKKIINDAVKTREEKDSRGDVIFLDRFNAKMIDLFADARESAIEGLEAIEREEIVDKKKDYDVCVLNLQTVINEANRLLSFKGNDQEVFETIESCFRNIALNSASFSYAKTSYEFRELIGPALTLPVIMIGAIRGFGDYVKLPTVDVKTVLDQGLEGLLEKQKERTRVLRQYKNLLERMDDEYSRIKKRIRVMDFSDYEHYALEILNDPQVRAYYKDKFSEIYVDEYQDNSSLQDAIVETISNNNIFMVGDVKQSIYKFRYANPNLFNSRKERYFKEDGGKLHLLNNNFRSTPEILDFVNMIFSQLMSSDATEIEYDESHKLIKAPTAEYGNSLPKIVLVDDTQKRSSEEDPTADEMTPEEEILNENSAFTLELKGIYSEIKKYLSDPSHKPSDICILTRTNSRARDISNALKSLGVPSAFRNEKNIYEDSDIATICSLITVLGNQHRNECLLGVMLADYRFSNFTVDDIASICVYADKNGLLNQDLITKLRFYADQKTPEDVKIYERVNRLLSALDDLRSEAMMFNIGELIEKIYAKTGVLSNIKKRPNGDVKKLRVFKDWLCSSFMDRGSDIASIATMLEELKINVKSGAGFDFESNESNAITVMTYHKSKGLEFPFVIVSQVCKKDNKNDDEKYILFDDKYGFISYDFSEEEIVSRTLSFENQLYKDEVHLSEISESLRLLYVALTRAEKQLSVVTRFSPVKARKPAFKSIARNSELKISRENHLKLADIYDEFLASLVRVAKISEIRESYEINLESKNAVKDITDFDGVSFEVVSPDDLSLEAIDRMFDEDTPSVVHLNVSGYDKYGNPIFPEYQYEKSVTSASKTSVSEIKKEEQKLGFDLAPSDEEEKKSKKIPINLIVPNMDYFESTEDYKSASSKGTLIHNLLHFLDFVAIADSIASGKTSKEALSEEIEYLKGRGIIKLDMIPVISAFEEQLCSFIESPLFTRIVASEREDKAFFEKPIMFSVKVQETDDDTLVQGVLDVLFFEGDEAVIVDYKTDRIASKDMGEITKEIKDRHGLQLDLYAASVEASGIKVKEKIVWLIRKGIMIDL